MGWGEEMFVERNKGGLGVCWVYNPQTVPAISYSEGRSAEMWLSLVPCRAVPKNPSVYRGKIHKWMCKSMMITLGNWWKLAKWRVLTLFSERSCYSGVINHCLLEIRPNVAIYRVKRSHILQLRWNLPLKCCNKLKKKKWYSVQNNKTSLHLSAECPFERSIQIVRPAELGSQCLTLTVLENLCGNWSNKVSVTLNVIKVWY